MTVHSWVQNNWTYNVTIGVLTMFVFVSGIFLGKQVAGTKAVLQFYTKRLIRIYPLFFLSAVTMQPLAGISLNNKILSLTGLSSFFGSSPSTLWFVIMLFFFYFITPILVFKDTYRYRITISIGMLLIICLLKYIAFSNMDIRILMYLPFYMFAIIYGNVIKKGFKNTVLPWISLSIFICISIGVNASELSSELFTILFTWLSGSLFIYGVIGVCQQIFRGCNSTLLNKLGYSSFCMYLFHRQFWYNLVKWVNVDNNMIIVYAVYVPLLCVLSYFIQSGYDVLIDTVRKRRR